MLRRLWLLFYEVLIGKVALGEDGLHAGLVVNEVNGWVDGIAAEGDGEIEEESFRVGDSGSESEFEEP
jgi:hypothetical protein